MKTLIASLMLLVTVAAQAEVYRDVTVANDGCTSVTTHVDEAVTLKDKEYYKTAVEVGTIVQVYVENNERIYNYTLEASTIYVAHCADDKVVVEVVEAK